MRMLSNRAIVMVQIMAATKRSDTVFNDGPKAYHVENRTSGLMDGAAKRMMKTVRGGTPLRSRVRTRGTVEQSQTGRSVEWAKATTQPVMRPRGKKRASWRGERKTSIAAAMRELIAKKGKD